MQAVERGVRSQHNQRPHALCESTIQLSERPVGIAQPGVNHCNIVMRYDLTMPPLRIEMIQLGQRLRPVPAPRVGPP